MSVLSRISNCQGLGRKNKFEIMKTDRNLPASVKETLILLAVVVGLPPSRLMSMFTDTANVSAIGLWNQHTFVLAASTWNYGVSWRQHWNYGSRGRHYQNTTDIEMSVHFDDTGMAYVGCRFPMVLTCFLATSWPRPLTQRRWLHGSIRPVLKHGPRSLQYVGVHGRVNLLAQWKVTAGILAPATDQSIEGGLSMGKAAAGSHRNFWVDSFQTGSGYDNYLALLLYYYYSY